MTNNGPAGGRVLITGGAGFLGSWLVEGLLASNTPVTVLDNLSPQIHGHLPDPAFGWRDSAGLRFERADVRDALVLDRLLADCDAVVHLAAETGTGQSMYQIGRYYDVNVQATATLLELIATRHRHVRKVVLASSRSIYGEGAYLSGDRLVVPASRNAERMRSGQWEPLGPGGEPLTLIATPEHAPPQPASVYAATKLANEQLGRVFAEAYGVNVVAMRFQNVYGERQSLRNPYTGILSIFSNRMRQGLPINIFEDGLETRDFVHVSDVVRAVQIALERRLEGFAAVNVGSGRATSVLEISDLLRKHLGSSSELRVTGDFRVGDIRHCYASLDRAFAVLGYEPKVDLEAGVAAFCRWVTTQAVIEDQSAQAQSELAALGLGTVGS